MTDAAIIAASYAAERNYSHNPDDVINASDAVGAWGTAKESTTELVDLSGNGNIADIHGPMPAEGFIQGRRFGGISDSLSTNLSFSAPNYITTRFLVKNNINALYQWFINGGQSVSDGSYSIVRSGNTNNLQYRYSNGISSTAYIHAINIFNGENDTFIYIEIIADYINKTVTFYKNGIVYDSGEMTTPVKPITTYTNIGIYTGNQFAYDGIINFVEVHTSNDATNFNTLARLPFWSVNYTDYPDNVTEYTDRLPYSSTIISSGTFKVDDDKLQCVSAGTITYSASYEFDGSEYIKVEIGGVEYAGTGTITQGNTTVSVAQGSNKVTIAMGTADTIDNIDIQFREEV